MQQLLSILDQAYDHRSWHGTNLRGSIRRVSRPQASWRPAPGRHNIWELVAHAAYWKYVVWRRLAGAPRGAFPLKGSNWFRRPHDASDAAWQAGRTLLEDMHRSLRAAAASLLARELTRTLNGGKETGFSLLSGAAAHDLYHAGQIQLLKKLSAHVAVFAVLVSLLARPAALAAQTPTSDPHSAQPQRPTVATHAGTVATGWLEIEAGTEFDRYADTSRGAVLPVLAKVGLAPRVQLEVQTVILRPPGSTTTGVGDSTIGVKWRLVETAPIVGNVATVSSVKLPTGSADSATGTGTTDLNLLLVSSRKIGVVEMDLNLGYTRRGGDGTLTPRNASVWAAAFGGPAHGRLGWVAELNGFPATSGPAGARAIVAVLAGPSFAVRDWLVLDVAELVAIAGPQPRALFAGVTYNAGRLWR
jgi:hypothetical protein